RSGMLHDQRYYGQYNDNTVQDICQSYESLLDFEPTYDEHKVDPNFVVVHPYYRDVVVNLDIFQYRFLLRVIALYLNNAVDISHFVTLST
ncbi:MAG TPA: hypothetical protein V6C65_36095, partial [Allocoleopsis sp.]